MSKFESLLAPALREALQAPELISWNNWNTILNFVALVAARNPVMRQRATKRATDRWIRGIEEATDTPDKYAQAIAKAQAAGDLPGDVNAAAALDSIAPMTSAVVDHGMLGSPS